MASADSWPLIERHGLLSVQRMLERVPLELHTDIANHRKRNSYPLEMKGFGTIVIRDQSALNQEKLERSLDPDCSVEEWRKLLDSRVFLWAQRGSLDTLLAARKYRHNPQVIIEVDTMQFFEAYQDKIEVADINTGSVLHKPASRGFGTFQTIDRYKRVGRREIVEVTVRDEIFDISKFVIRATRREPSGSETALFIR